MTDSIIIPHFFFFCTIYCRFYFCVIWRFNGGSHFESLRLRKTEPSALLLAKEKWQKVLYLLKFNTGKTPTCAFSLFRLRRNSPFCGALERMGISLSAESDHRCARWTGGRFLGKATQKLSLRLRPLAMKLAHRRHPIYLFANHLIFN